MPENEQSVARRDNETAPDPYQQLELAVPSLAVALQSSPEERLDRHFGRGVGFKLGGETQIELFPQVVRVTSAHAQIAVARTEAAVSHEGVTFEHPDRFLSVGANGDVLFQSFPTAKVEERKPAHEAVPVSTPPLIPEKAPEPIAAGAPSPVPARAEQKEKSERYVGRMGEIRTHHTKAGKLVAEVEVTIPDPERPGASKLVKFAAFNKMAEALRDRYQPGQLVTAVGIPHELKRTNRDGRQWTERQLYFVQLPKPR